MAKPQVRYTKQPRRNGGPPKGGHTSPATEWKPGQSGNPGGVPRDAGGVPSKTLGKAYREALKMVNATGRTMAQCIAEAIAKQALKGSVSAAAEIADRAEGKAIQPIVSAELSDLTTRFDRMGDEELEAYASRAELPPWFDDLK